MTHVHVTTARDRPIVTHAVLGGAADDGRWPQASSLRQRVATWRLREPCASLLTKTDAVDCWLPPRGQWWCASANHECGQSASGSVQRRVAARYDSSASSNLATNVASFD